MKQKMGLFVFKSAEMDKKVNALLPVVETAAVLIIRDGAILVAFNERWGAFSLPMTKRRSWAAPNVKDTGERVEDWEDAATRAAAECLGTTLTKGPTFMAELAEFQQSDRDSEWKRYHLRAYRFDVDSDAEGCGRPIVEWLSADELLDENRKPLSPTTRYIINELRLQGQV